MPVTYFRTTLVNLGNKYPNQFDDTPLTVPFASSDPTAVDFSWGVVVFISGTNSDALCRVKAPQAKYDEITSRDDVAVLTDQEAVDLFNQETGQSVSFSELDSRYNFN